MAKWTIKVPGEAEQQVEADQLVVNEKARAFELYKAINGWTLVTSVGIGPGVRVIREADFATTDTLS